MGAAKGRTAVTVLRATAKAALVSGAGHIAWVQLRWLRGDQTVKTSTLLRAAAAYQQRQQQTAKPAGQPVMAGQQWRERSYPIGPIHSSTAEAVAVQVQITAVGYAESRLVWYPRSLVRDGQAPGWLIARKLSAIYSELGPMIDLRVDGIPLAVQRCVSWA